MTDARAWNFNIAVFLLTDDDLLTNPHSRRTNGLLNHIGLLLSGQEGASLRRIAESEERPEAVGDDLSIFGLPR